MPDLPKSVLGRMQAQAAPQEHPDADLLTAFSEQALTGRERENVFAHLAVCAACREAVALASPQPVAQQPVGVFVPWYKRPSVFAWAGTLATVAVIGALVLNYSRYPRATFSEAVPAKVASTSPAENKPAAPTAQAEAKGGAGPDRIEVRRQSAAADKAEVAQKRKADEEHARMAPAPVAGGAPAQAQAKDEAKLSGGVLQDQFRAMKPATAPPPGPPAQAAVATRADEMQQKQQVPASKEAITVESAAPARANRAETPAAGGVVGGILHKSKAAVAPTFRWSLSDKGKLQRSADQGRTWQPALASEPTVFRALAVVGNEVWAGGSGASLLHSADGATWTRQVLPGASADVVSLQFSDTQHGTARTADDISWTTSDGGQHWAKQ